MLMGRFTCCGVWRGTGHRRRCNCPAAFCSWFWIDSFMEVTSGSVLLWRMSVDADVLAGNRTRDVRCELRRLLLASGRLHRLRVCYGSTVQASPTQHSGIVLACVSLVVMPLLSRPSEKWGRPGQRRRQADADRQVHIYATAGGRLPRRAHLSLGSQKVRHYV